MPASLSFDAAWRDLNRRSATLWFLLFSCIPGMFLLYLLNDLLLQDAPLLLVALAWMTAVAWAGSRGELCMSPLLQGVLRELVLSQAAQAQLRLLQPDQGGERHAITGGNRLP